jgi:hypothetical protein
MLIFQLSLIFLQLARKSPNLILLQRRTMTLKFHRLDRTHSLEFIISKVNIQYLKLFIILVLVSLSELYSCFSLVCSQKICLAFSSFLYVNMPMFPCFGTMES